MKIITRAQWGARPFVRPRQTVALATRRYYVIHYPGAGIPPADVKAYAKWIERIHIDQNGWSGVGYNYFISHGQVAEGCGRDIVGSHSPQHNRDGIGVNIWTSNGVPLDEDLALARELYDDLNRAKKGAPLTRWWHGRDYATECPGPILRNWVKAGMPYPSGHGDTGGTRPSDPIEEEYDMKPEDTIVRDSADKPVRVDTALARGVSAYEQIGGLRADIQKLLARTEAVPDKDGKLVDQVRVNYRAVSAYEQAMSIWGHLADLSARLADLRDSPSDDVREAIADAGDRLAAAAAALKAEAEAEPE